MPVVVLVMILLLAVSHHSGGAIGAVIAIGLVALILGIELPLISRWQRRRQETHRAQMPAGGFYAGRSSLLPSRGQHGLPATGDILLADAGINFSPKKASGESLNVSWDSIRRIGLGPRPGKIGVGMLTLTFTDGSTRAFTVPSYETMARVLSDHP